MAARCIGVLGQVETAPIMEYVVEDIVPSLGATDKVLIRQGSVEAVAIILCRVTSLSMSLTYILCLSSHAY